MASEVKVDPKTMKVMITFDLEDKESLQRMVNAIRVVLMTVTQDGRAMKIDLFPGKQPPADPEVLPPAPGPKTRKPRSPQPVAAKT